MEPDSMQPPEDQPSTYSILEDQYREFFGPSQNINELPSLDNPPSHLEYPEGSVCAEGGYFEPVTTLANLMWELAYGAYSCLACTPFGLPGEFQVWTNSPTPDCCDSIYVWLRGYKPVEPYKEHWWDDAYFGPAGNCGQLNFVPEIVVSLLRPCRPLFNRDGSRFSSAKDKNQYGFNIMIDVETLTCCLRETLSNEEFTGMMGGECGGQNYSMGRVTTNLSAAYCTRIDIPITVNLSSSCCPDGSQDLGNAMAEVNAAVLASQKIEIDFGEEIR